MKMMGSFFAAELKSRLRPRDIVIYLAFILVLILMARDGRQNYLNTQNNTKPFQETEKTKVDNYILYSQYGGFGLRVMFIPSPYSVLFTNPAFEGLLSNVNTAERLSIYKSLKGRNFFSEHSGQINYLVILLVFSVFFGPIYGYYTVKSKLFLKFLSSVSSRRKVYIAAVGARLLLYNLAVLTAVFLSLLWLLAGNINLFQPPLLYIIAAVVVVNGFFFSIGCAAGMLGSRSAAAITIAVFYFLSLLGIPWLAGKAARANANNLQSLFQFELENTRIMMAVEKRLIEKFGVFKSGDIAPPEIIKAVREVVNNEFEELRRRETGMKNDILGKIHAQHTLSAFYPVLFYMSLAREITGQGGLSLIDFYTYGQEIKKQFITFYVTMKFLSRNKPGEVESFIKANENLFKAHSLVPRGFWLGAAVTLLYTVALLGLAYFLFNRRLHPLPGRDSIDTWAISLSKGEDAAVVTTFPRTAATFYNVLSGKHNRFGGKLAVAGKPVRAGEKQAFTYLCAPGEIPGEIPVNSLLRIFKLALNVTPEEAVGLSDGLSAEACKKRYDKLEPWEKVKVLINAARLSRGAVFLFHNLEDALPADFVDSYEKEVQALKGAGKLVIHIVTRGSVLRGVSRTFAVYKKGNSYGIRKLGPA